MSFSARLLALVNAIGADIKSLFTRALPPGGTAGDVLKKTSATNFDCAWSKPSTAPRLARLLIYYGYPIAWRGLWAAPAVIADIAAHCDTWVVGDTYQSPTHPEYASTVSIINGVRGKGVKVYGYVPIGVSTSNRSISTMQTAIDQWVAIGVDGIFLDEFGFDYQNTRTRQKTMVDYVHSKGLPYVANAWTFHDVACDNISELPWGSGDWRYVNFQTYNPTNLALSRTASDIYLIENFCYDNTGALNQWDSQERLAIIKALNASKHMVLWAEAVLAESSGGVVDMAKIGSLNSLADVAAYVAANALLFDLGMVGIGGYSFGSGGVPVLATLPALPDAALPATADPSLDYTACVFSRSFGTYGLTVTNLAGVQSVQFGPAILGDAPALKDVWKPKVVKMAANQTSSVVALANVTDLVVVMVAGAVYEVEAFLTFRSAATTTGINVGFISPAGSDPRLEITVPLVSTAAASHLRKVFPNAAESVSGNVLGTGVTATASNHTAHVVGIVTCGATAGNFQLQFASEVAGSAVTLQAGSLMRSRRIA